MLHAWRFAFLLLIPFAWNAHAQEGSSSGPRPTSLAVLIFANSGLGAIEAGVTSSVRHKSLRTPIVKGAIAGLVVFAGKWVVSRNDYSTNLLGRSIAAAGSSGILDAAAGRPLFTIMTFSYGPVNLHVDRRETRLFHLKLNLATSIILARELRGKEQHLQPTRSILPACQSLK